MSVKKTPSVAFKHREGTGKSTTRKLRAQGIIPVVLYGAEYQGGVSGSICLKDISGIANSVQWETTAIKLNMDDGKEELALLREVQRHPVSRNIRHIDLFQLVKGNKVRVSVPVSLVNKEQCVGVKMGGKLEQLLRDVIIDVDPNEIPGELIIDVAKMGRGDEILMSDFDLPPSAEMITPSEQIIVIIARPKSETEEADEEEEHEVEVAAKGKAKKVDE